MINRFIIMKELSTTEKSEIRIKQDRLRALLNIDSLLGVAPSEDCVDRESIVDFTSHEKNSLVLDIINSLDIQDYDTSFYEENGGKGFKVDCTVEDSLNHLERYNDFPIMEALYNELVVILANYDIEDVVGYEIVSKYLKMISVTQMCYEDLALEDCKKIC